MSGKRSWGVIRKYILQAAADKTAKGAGLSDLIFIPEPFYPERQAEIAQRRIARVMKVTAASNGAAKATQTPVIVLGEGKESQKGRQRGRERVLQYVETWV